MLYKKLRMLFPYTFWCIIDIAANNTVSSLIASFDYEADKSDVWDSIPERDWKLLAALARKRDEDIERERLADQFQKMWLKEKEEREMVCYVDIACSNFSYFYTWTRFLLTGNSYMTFRISLL